MSNFKNQQRKKKFALFKIHTRDRFLSSQFEGILIYLRFIALGVRLGIRSLCIINMFSSKCFNICKVLVNDDYLGNKRNTVDINAFRCNIYPKKIIYLYMYMNFKNQPIRNKNRLWRRWLLTDRDEMSILYRGPSIDASYQVSVHFAKR
jgi:hypothetical protein